MGRRGWLERNGRLLARAVSERPRWLRIVKWSVVVLFAVRLLQLFVSWLTSAG
jgi:hypothetical protein